MEETTKTIEDVEKVIITLAILALEASKDDKSAWPEILMSFHQTMKQVNE